jgi:hypothetical protein
MAQIMDYLKGSFAALHRAVAAVNEGNMVEPMAVPLRQSTRLQLAVDVVAHSYDHYGGDARLATQHALACWGGGVAEYDITQAISEDFRPY